MSHRGPCEVSGVPMCTRWDFFLAHGSSIGWMPLCDGAQMAIFGDFFASCISSELRAASFRPAS